MEAYRAADGSEKDVGLTSDQPTSQTSSIPSRLPQLKRSLNRCAKSAGRYAKHPRDWWPSLFTLIWGQSAQDSSPYPKPKEKVIVRQLKTIQDGYPNLAVFLDSDESFMIYRRFGYLQSRLLLDKQNELSLLEQKLDCLDETENLDHPDRVYKYNLNDEEVAHRRKLMMEIESRYCEYANLMDAASRLVSLNKPTSDEYRSVFKYHHNKPRIHPDERSYICHKEDLITLRPGRDHAWLDTILEKFLMAIHCRPVEWIFCSAERAKKSEPANLGEEKNEIYYSRDRIAWFGMILVTVMILSLFIVPIYLLLYHINGSEGSLTARTIAICIAILLLFTLAFLAIISSFTNARRHEILAAAAAYCAILVVFFGNVGSGS